MCIKQTQKQDGRSVIKFVPNCFLIIAGEVKEDAIQAVPIPKEMVRIKQDPEHPEAEGLSSQTVGFWGHQLNRNPPRKYPEQSYL